MVFRPSAAKIVNSSKQAIRGIKALEYYGKVVCWDSSGDSTTYEAAVKLLKDSTLNPVGYQVKLNTPDNDIIVCNQDSFYYLENFSKEMFIQKLGKKLPYQLRTIAYRSVIGEALTFSDPFKTGFIDKTATLKCIGTEKINGKKYWIIQAKGQWAEEIELIRQFYINRENYLPLRVKSTFFHLHPKHINRAEWNATNLNYKPEFSQVEFSKPTLPSGFQEKYFQEK